jgi:hypothetical protein
MHMTHASTAIFSFVARVHGGSNTDMALHGCALHMETVMPHPREQVRIIHLDHEQLLILDGGRDGRVRVLYGGAWLTEEGSPDDAFLRAGEAADTQGGQVVVQVQPGTGLQLSWARPSVTTAWRRLRAWAARWHLGPVPDACG